ncbi:unnamed protein product [Brachionus calyciflorus]|uniref:Uncharacterized protein n=1 Tax=Brachionus calyciflorus TaxID=104777 RepID=A0A813M044_9BILA|nr:unnamed protein product [Brachionus calyciflorus]
MNCFKFLKLRQNKVEHCAKFSNSVDKINEILVKNGKNKISNIYFSPNSTENEQIDKLGSILFELILTDYRLNNSTIYNFIIDCLTIINNTNFLNINNIKNFLNQTILHLACENNDLKLCKLLVKNGADFFLEDNYLQTPFVLAAKRNYFNILEIFCSSIQNGQNNTQVLRATYNACCSGNEKIVEYLFEKFSLHTEDLINLKHFSNSNKISELNLLHVCCYKSHLNIVNFLLSKFRNSSQKSEYLNSAFNEYRDSTSLEEAFKGFVSLNLNVNKNNLNDVKFFQKTKILEFKKLINLLIENGARFSNNFVLSNGLVKLVYNTYIGNKKDTDFLHFLNCCIFLFKFNLNEIFLFENEIFQRKEFISKESNDKEWPSREHCFNLKEMLNDFLFHVYSICSKVIKDHKASCLNMYIELIVNLHYSGQFLLNVKNYQYLKERNLDIYELLCDIAKEPFTLKNLCSNSLRKTMRCYGIEKVKQLHIPEELKKEIFLSTMSRAYQPEFDYYTYFLLKNINDKTRN